jgi:nickel-dependent lactate racemase
MQNQMLHLVEQAVNDALGALGSPLRLTVLVNDPQRHTDSRSVLQILSRTVDPSGIRILVATGSHRFARQDRECFEHELQIGSPFGGISWHDARAKDLIPLPAGAWRCHPWLLGQRPVLAIGSVEPHYFAGFTGAHKTCTIGCAAHEDIQRNHAAALLPEAQPGRLDGNPIHEGVVEMLNSLRSVQRVATVNLVQTGANVLAAAGGEPITALRRLLPIAESTFIRRIDRPVDALVAHVSGPLGATFYQADKGIKNNEWAVRDGGVLVLVAPCPGGIGQDHFVALLREAPTYERAVEIVRRRGYRLGDHKAVKLRYLSDPAKRGVRVFVVSDGLSPADAAVLEMTKVGSVEEALAQAGVAADRPAALQVPDAGNTVTLVSPERPASAGERGC